MARMYPSKLPVVSSSAERQLFELFQGLPAEYRVFHGVHLRQRKSGHRNNDKRGEIDFVILHPRYGLLLVEAKGGKLRRDGRTGVWYSEDGRGHEHQIHDPFVQVDEQAYALEELIEEGVATRRHEYRWETGVALIQTVVKGPIALHAPPDAVIDSTDFPDMEAAVIRLFRKPLERPLAPEAVEAVTDLLSPPGPIVTPGLNSRFEEIDRTRIEPTAAQRFLLDHFELVSRARVMGCAGSGKTLIAMEKARRLARAGFDVLFVCYNRQLALWAAAAIKDGSFPAQRVKVRHFHGLADDACAAAGIALFPNPQSPDWENVPARMVAALAQSPMKFDAIVADEGQDFRAEWWLILMSELLKNPDEDPFYVFYDANQLIYHETLELPAELPPYPLVHNLRNTRQIYEEVVRYYQGDPAPECAGPEGVAIVRISEPTTKGLRHALNELINEQKVPASEIIVLTGRSQEKSELQEGQRLGNIALTWLPPKPPEVQVATVHSFKGLEKRVVILVELDHYFRDEDDKPDRSELGRSLLYIGASRATHHLVLIGTEPA